MKYLLTTLMVACMSPVPAIVTAQDLSFNMEIISARSSVPMKMKVAFSGPKMSMELVSAESTGNMRFIADNATGKQYMLMNHNGQKMAMAVQKTLDKANDLPADPKVTVTRETKTIGGFLCKKVITETEGQKAVLWVTEDVGLQYADFHKMVHATKGPKGPVANLPDLKNMKGFPVEIQSTDLKTNETVTVRIRDISKARVPASLFSTEGYQVMDMGNMNR